MSTQRLALHLADTMTTSCSGRPWFGRVGEAKLRARRGTRDTLTATECPTWPMGGRVCATRVAMTPSSGISERHELDTRSVRLHRGAERNHPMQRSRVNTRDPHRFVAMALCRLSPACRSRLVGDEDIPGEPTQSSS